MADEQAKKRREFSNAYELFVLVLTILSLAVMVLLILPLPPATEKLLTIYDNLICVVFLGDFAMRVRRAPSFGQYFFRERGWLDLLGSIPSLGVFKYAALFRLARLSRLARIVRLLRGKRGQEIVKDVLTHRSQYAAFVTITAAGLVMVIASILVLTFEAASADSNIKTGGEALWWTIVTLTTVGYGDFFPVTTGGRITAVFVMFMGVGIIGALASILASFLVAPPEPESNPEPATVAATASSVAVAEMLPEASPAIEGELRAIRAELEALRKTLRVS